MHVLTLFCILALFNASDMLILSTIILFLYPAEHEQDFVKEEDFPEVKVDFQVSFLFIPNIIYFPFISHI